MCPTKGQQEAQAVAALRAEASQRRNQRDFQCVATILRKLHRLTLLKPGEHRQLFRWLRSRGGLVLLERYQRRLVAAECSHEAWSRLSLLLWSQGLVIQLLELATRCPAGDVAASDTLLSYASVSVKHKEASVALPILRALSRGAEPVRLLRIAELLIQISLPIEAAAALDDANSTVWEASTLMIKRSELADTVLTELSSKLGVLNSAAVLSALPRLKRLSGDNPLLSRIESMASAWSLGIGANSGGSTSGRPNSHSDPVPSEVRLDAALFTLPSGGSETCLPPGLDQHGRLTEDPLATALDTPSELSISQGQGYDTVARPIQEKLSPAYLLRVRATRSERTPRSAPQPFRGHVLGEAQQQVSSRSSAPSAFSEGPLKSIDLSLLGEDNPRQALGRLRLVVSKEKGGGIPPLVQGAMPEFNLSARDRTIGGGHLEHELKAISVDILDIRHLEASDEAIGDTAAAESTSVLRHPDALDASGWLRVARMLRETDQDALSQACCNAAATGVFNQVVEASNLLLERGFRDTAVALWAGPLGSLSPIQRQLGRLRASHAAGRSDAIFDEALTLLEVIRPLTSVEPDDVQPLIALIRLMVRVGIAHQSYRNPPTGWIERHEPTNAFELWVDAMIRTASLDFEGAFMRLREAILQPPTNREINLHAEIALLHLRLNRFQDADQALGDAPEMISGRYYPRQFEALWKVKAFCGVPGNFPESLIEVIIQELASHPIGYDPDPGHVVTISGSLAQGGSERQTVNIVRELTHDPRIARQTVLIRSVDNEAGFFLNVLEPLPVERIIYGGEWRARSDIEEWLPQLQQRPRLLKAIDLLPHAMREEIVRLVAVILKKRPKVAHIRQDIPAAALACAIAGVPTFFIHRGSLARNNWDHSPLQAETVLRPMRHIYRLLLQRTSFFFVNNSAVGLQTDKDWIGLAQDDRFHIVHNAIDFARLGDEGGRNETLRAELGIPVDAPVIGGMFRMVGVKRPMLWADIARLILEQAPSAHFVIAGELSEYGDAVRAFAEAHGFPHRLHMPGAVTAVGDWYRIMDVALLTSDREGLPNANIEAQHFGVPVVSSDVGGAAETFEHGVTGYLVSHNAGPAAYADRIIAILGDETWLRQARRRAPALAHDRFGAQHAVQRLIELYGLTPPSA